MGQIAQMLMNLAQIPQPWILSLDRTNWSFGKTHFNILMLGVVHEGIAYPVLWTFLEKKGNSNSDEQMDLLDRFEALFPKVEVSYLTGDREFIGKAWLSYLLMDKPIPFRIRIRQSDKICAGVGQPALSGAHLFSSVSVGETRILAGRHWVWAMKTGLWQHSLQPIPLKSHQRRARSLFRSGFDYLRNIFTNLDHKFDAFLDSLQFLSCT